MYRFPQKLFNKTNNLFQNAYLKAENKAKHKKKTNIIINFKVSVYRSYFLVQCDL